MFRAKPVNGRKHERRRMRRGAWLSLGDGSAPMPCVIWDFSAGGCRLAAPHAINLPVVFTLTMSPNAGDRRSCRVVWRRGGYIGVQFIDSAEAERIADALPEDRPGLYRNNDRDAFLPKQQKAAAAPQAKKPRKRPRWHIELY
jgi:hypothetical protein